MKMSLIPLAIVAAFSCLVACQGQITSNVLERVLLIRGPVFTGTAFTIDVEGRQYLVTAKHMVAGLKGEDTIHILRDGEWSPLRVTVLRCDDPIDIAVLVPPSQLTVDYPLEPTSGGLAVGGDAFFVGFPAGPGTSVILHSGYPLGLAKKATVSAFDPLPDHKGMRIVLDGYNNPGFSGSPVVFRDLSQSGLVYKVAAVLVGFKPEGGPVRKAQEIRPEQLTPEDRAQSRIVEYQGRLLRLGEETGNFVRLNTGIAISYDIRPAVVLIHQHPIGPKVSDNFEMK
ncbi:MAG: serine protease [Acidobacteriia bacterium]|nr:serine protease [Terriglobia bacterium]